MKCTKESDLSRDVGKDEAGPTKEKLSRREFAKTSVAAGAAAVAIPGVVGAASQSDSAGSAAAKPSKGHPPGTSEYREGMTIPAEYYYEMEHYLKDERIVAEQFWLLADHVSRIPEPGDYFVFKFGLGESVIVVRGEDNEIRALHNVCRHRGSRLCKHTEDPQWNDERLSVKQLGESGNAQFFRCPYHAWLYDLDGSLMDAYDVHDDFKMEQNGLVPCHMRIEAGHIFLNFSRAEEPPAFDAVFGYGFDELTRKWPLADLKVGTRRSYQMNANWKLALENFMECYHCGPAHDYLVTTHNWDYRLSDRQRERWDQMVAEWLGPELAADRGDGAATAYDGELNPNFLTGSVDGKPLAPFLPDRNDWTRDTMNAITGWDTAYWQPYDDHVMVARFTPRGPELTDIEILWLVHPDAEAGKDFDAEKMMELWHLTILEDAWIVENNHIGIKSMGYRTGRYTVHEGLLIGFMDWYMKEIVKA